jgi:hypothetical protein
MSGKPSCSAEKRVLAVLTAIDKRDHWHTTKQLKQVKKTNFFNCEIMSIIQTTIPIILVVSDRN